MGIKAEIEALLNRSRPHRSVQKSGLQQA